MRVAVQDDDEDPGDDEDDKDEDDDEDDDEDGSEDGGEDDDDNEDLPCPGLSRFLECLLKMYQITEARLQRQDSRSSSCGIMANQQQVAKDLT